MRSNRNGGFRALYRIVPAIVLIPAAIAWTTIRNGLTMQPESRLWVEGTSTVRGFECKAVELEARVDAGPSAAKTILAGEKAVNDVELKVPVEKMDCGNGTMNDHMRKALKAAEHPVITFRLSSYELAKASEGMQATLNGTLTLGGVERPVVIAADVKEATNGALRVAGSHDVMMKEFGLKPPSLMMGTMKVNERVKVHFDLLLK